MARVLLIILSVKLALVFTHRSGRDKHHGVINAHGEEVLLHTKHVVAEHEGIVGSLDFLSNSTQSIHMSPAPDVRFTDTFVESDRRGLVDNASQDHLAPIARSGRHKLLSNESDVKVTKEEKDNFFARLEELAEDLSNNATATAGMAKTLKDLCDNAFVGNPQQILDDMCGDYVKQDYQIEGNDWFAKQRSITSPEMWLIYHRIEEGGFWVFSLTDGKIVAYAETKQYPGWPTAVESAWHFPGADGAAPQLYIREGAGEFLDVKGYLEPLSIEFTNLPEPATPAQLDSGCSSKRTHPNDFALNVLSGMIIVVGVQ